MSAKLHGAEAFERELREYPKHVKRKVVAAVAANATRLAEESRDHAPVGIASPARGRGGHLRQSITAGWETRGDTVIGAWGTNVEYAEYVEFGTDRIAGGAVKRWKPGERPVERWKTKRIRARKHSQSDMGQQMPFIRPAWDKLGERVLKDLKEAGA